MIQCSYVSLPRFDHAKLVRSNRGGAAASSLSQNGERRLKNVGPRAVVTSRSIHTPPYEVVYFYNVNFYAQRKNRLEAGFSFCAR